MQYISPCIEDFKKKRNKEYTRIAKYLKDKKFLEEINFSFDHLSESSKKRAKEAMRSFLKLVAINKFLNSIEEKVIKHLKVSQSELRVATILILMEYDFKPPFKIKKEDFIIKKVEFTKASIPKYLVPEYRLVVNENIMVLPLNYGKIIEQYAKRRKGEFILNLKGLNESFYKILNMRYTT